MSLYYEDDHVRLYHGDALEVARTMPDGSADCIVTSPPYFGLRDYGTEGQYGLEPTPAEYVETMRALFSELRRVLADDGTLWLNLGDSYSGSWGNQGCKDERGRQRPINKPMMQNVHDGRYPSTGSRTGSIRPGQPPAKNLLGIPWRVAFALQDDGWVLRQEVIWSKRNCMPEAVKDRPSRSHETVFLFSKKQRYWFDADAIREESDPEQEAHNERYAKVYDAQAERAATTGQPGNINSAGIHSRPGKPGRNARSVWTISRQPFPGAHFATMPPELARRAIVAGCKPGGTVLDPFSGSGTTGLVAQENGRKYVGIDISASYLKLSLETRLRNGVFDLGGIA